MKGSRIFQLVHIFLLYIGEKVSFEASFVYVFDSTALFYLIFCKSFILFTRLEEKRYKKNFQERDFLRDLKFPPFLCSYVAEKKERDFYLFPSSLLKRLDFKVLYLARLMEFIKNFWLI